MASFLPATELLKLGNEGREIPFLTKYWSYVLGVPFGICTGMVLNFSTRRPLFSGIQKHIVGVAGWSALLTYVQKRRDDYYAEKDAVFRNYIELHPEDFPTPEDKKYCDILEPWIPIR